MSETFKAWLSVLQRAKVTSLIPSLYMWLTALPPPPPTPITLMMLEACGISISIGNISSFMMLYFIWLVILFIFSNVFRQIVESFFDIIEEFADFAVFHLLCPFKFFRFFLFLFFYPFLFFYSALLFLSFFFFFLFFFGSDSKGFSFLRFEYCGSLYFFLFIFFLHLFVGMLAK